GAFADARCKRLVDRAQQILALERLGGEALESYSPAPFIGLALRLSRDDDDGDAPRRFVGPQRFEHLEAAQVGQVEIEQNQLGRVFQDRSQSFLWIGGGPNRVAGGLKMQPQEISEGRVVFDR